MKAWYLTTCALFGLGGGFFFSQMFNGFPNKIVTGAAFVVITGSFVANRIILKKLEAAKEASAQKSDCCGGNCQ